jgi:hypothetical protein
MRDDQVELAVNLATGSISERLQALERLMQDGQVSPLPWLVWMAEDADAKVREKSIRLLGSIDNEDSRREMRLLMNREKDESLRGLLRQLSFASGSNVTLR